MRGSDPFYRDTWVEVQLDAIEENIKNVRKRLPKQTAIIAVVKANAYGHGAYEVAKTALASGASGLAVAFLDEALALRNDGIRAPILVLGAARPQDAPIAAENAVSLTVFQTDWLTEARQHLGGQKLSVHIKCDTGMGRIGVRSTEELKAVEKLIESETCFSFDGIFTHFATADEIDTALYEKQYSRFREMVESLGTRPPFVHCANSAAALRFDQTPFNAVRLGIVMYGLAPSPEMKAILPFPLKEAFSLHTKVTHVKQIHAGDTVSYGATYTADQDEWIATLPIGYADGWIRKLQGQEVIVGGEKAPIVGRICMDQCMVKLPHAVPVGTEAVLIGRQGEYSVPVDEIAEKLETINYEVTCSISARVPRIFMQKGQKVTKVLNFLLAK